MQSRADLRLLAAFAALSILSMVALLVVGSGAAELLHFGPLLAFMLPLVAGRYLGAETIIRIAAARRRGRSLHPRKERRSPRRAPRVTGLSGRLVVAARGMRAPPARAAAH